MGNRKCDSAKLATLSEVALSIASMRVFLADIVNGSPKELEFFNSYDRLLGDYMADFNLDLTAVSILPPPQKTGKQLERKYILHRTCNRRKSSSLKYVLPKIAARF